MHAAIARRPGPPEVLQPVDLPDPVPGPGQVVVAVGVAATTFVDTQLRAGAGPRPLSPTEFPVVLGNGVAGAVAAVGDGVDPSLTGTTVVTATGGRGGYATLAAAAAGDLHAVPDGLDVRDAAALLADGRTALALARAAAIRPGDTVAVTAAGGGVGSLLVQLAVDTGARVVALAGDAAKRNLARRLGAAAAVDYRQPGWPTELDGAVGPSGLDVAFDGVGGDVSWPLTARLGAGGRYLPHGIASGEWGAVDTGSMSARGVTTIPLGSVDRGPDDLHRLVDQALGLAAAGQLRPTVGLVLPLVRAADAHAAMEARQVAGKTLLAP